MIVKSQIILKLLIKIYKRNKKWRSYEIKLIKKQLITNINKRLKNQWLKKKKISMINKNKMFQAIT